MPIEPWTAANSVPIRDVNGDAACVWRATDGTVVTQLFGNSARLGFVVQGAYLFGFTIK